GFELLALFAELPNELQRRARGVPSVVFPGQGVAEIEEHLIAERAGEVAVEAAGDLGAALLQGGEQLVDLLDVGGSGGGARRGEAAAHRRELPALPFEQARARER